MVFCVSAGTHTVTMHGSVGDRRALEREALRNVIAQWNANRLDLFELSEPNEVNVTGKRENIGRKKKIIGVCWFLFL